MLTVLLKQMVYGSDQQYHIQIHSFSMLQLKSHLEQLKVTFSNPSVPNEGRRLS